MKLSIQQIYNSKIFVILCFLVFFKPGIFNYLPSLSKIDFLYTVLGIIITIILFFLEIIDKKKQNILITIFLLLVSLLSSTIINNGEVFSVLKTIIYIYACCIFTKQAMEKNPENFISIGHKVLFCIAFINLILLIIFPNGLYITEYYHNSYHFINTKNGFISFILTYMILSLLKHDICKSNNLKSILIVDIFISVVTMFLSESSTGLFTLILLICQMFFIRNKNRFIKIFKKIILLLVIITLGIIIFRIQYYFEGVIEAIFNKSADLTMRVEIWDKALDMIANKPIIGYGLNLSNGNILIGDTYYYSHNMLLEIMVSGGIISVFAFINVFLCLFKKIRKRKFKSNGLWYVLMGIVCFSVLSITEAPLTSYGFYMLFIIAYSDYFYVIKEKRK